MENLYYGKFNLPASLFSIERSPFKNRLNSMKAESLAGQPALVIYVSSSLRKLSKVLKKRQSLKWPARATFF